MTAIGCSAKANQIVNLDTSSYKSENINREFNIDNNTSLGVRAKNKNLAYGGFYYGDRQQFQQAQQSQLSLINECNILATGSTLGAAFPHFGQYNFTGTDYVVQFAAEKGILVNMSTSISQSNIPQWLIDKFKDSSTTSKEIEAILIDFVFKYSKHYSGRIHSRNLVNEAIYVQDGRADGFRDTTISGSDGQKFPSWFHFLGSHFIDLSFHVASQADPQAILTYNEQILFRDSPGDKATQNAILQLLQGLKSRGVPIHALGIQSHLGVSKNYPVDRESFKTFLQEVANLGLKIIITELDVADRESPPDINIRDREVAAVYEDYLNIALEQPATIAVINWGLSDRYSWLSDFAPREDGLPVRPLPFDSQFNRKLAWNAIARAFDHAPKRNNPINWKH